MWLVALERKGFDNTTHGYDTIQEARDMENGLGDLVPVEGHQVYKGWRGNRLLTGEEKGRSKE